jgi:hypothetical protein
VEEPVRRLLPERWWLGPEAVGRTKTKPWLEVGHDVYHALGTPVWDAVVVGVGSERTLAVSRFVWGTMLEQGREP